MTERQILECIRDIAEMEFHNTKDKWWQNLLDSIDKKELKRWWRK